MIINIRCYTCGKVLADKWEYFQRESEKLEKELKEKNETIKTNKYFTEPFKNKILDELELHKYCCRRHMLGHVDIIDNL